jgi:hypothetical protein
LSFIKRPNTNTCPGIDDFIRPNVDYEECQTCGGRVEFWSDEGAGECIDCGAKFKKKDPTPSCLEYCDYADTCKGIIMSRRNVKRT